MTSDDIYEPPHSPLIPPELPGPVIPEHDTPWLGGVASGMGLPSWGLGGIGD